ncbi:MAG TPA: DUF302 domain-containing protein [Chitinophaga sp.]|uniref:DUF302 domain-containing protein n=1 Tax=Chitinophaga sp. TaxID=1869181 RepID=UPI002B5D2723|nr:DUF302 domain-containing protein [Chitinophaga sp.]HVI47300.1 DUF302 domain-containing protein [Chitinophaga sp.]
MKTNNHTIVISRAFEPLLQAAREAIQQEGFLLIQEINPQAILAAHNMHIPPVRQLLYFHPDYMKEIIDKDPAAVIEAPLKLVLRETGATETTIHAFHPSIHFEGYKNLASLSATLATKTNNILAALQV